MAQGHVTQWNLERGTGFLSDDVDRTRVFFGDRALRGLRVEEIQIGLKVEFDRDQDRQGRPIARNVRRSESTVPRERSDAPATHAAPSSPSTTSPHRARTPQGPPAEIPVPRSLQQLLHRVPVPQRHPGLQLDRFSLPCVNQEMQRDILAAVATTVGDATLFVEVCQRRRAALALLGAEPWLRVTNGPLTLHLARAAALENAGLCLHPIYGFAYLPGTGLKGLARAFAETVWLQGLPEAGRAEGWRQIEQVFGWASGSDLLARDTRKPWKPLGVVEHGKHDAAASGSVVFHDAWPEAWPQLTVDIVNNHHATYYQDSRPPGDWDAPVPVYFLALPAGQTFSFALTKRCSDVSDTLLMLARLWTDSALTHLGFGSKTAAGYGYFQPLPELPLPSAPGRASCTVRLALVTPAFLAGAQHDERSGCDLRSATLRGLLRWWWRTLHAGFLSVPQLLALEGALWGDTQTGGAVQVWLWPEGPVRPEQYNLKDGFKPRPEFKRQHNLQDPPNNKTTQGLFYVSYGMDDGSRTAPRRRYFLDTGTAWSVQLQTRQTRYFTNRADAFQPDRRGHGIALPCEQVLEQAQAALWLLSHFGGVGSKARKGFGSVQVTGEALTGWDLERCRAVAAGLRQHLGLSPTFDAGQAESPALEQALGLIETLDTPWTDSWQALDQVGFAYQEFAQRYAHNPSKVALGLPRRIHGPRDDHALPNQTQIRWQPVELLHLSDDFPYRDRRALPRDARHASPLHIHLAWSAENRLQVRIIGFPARYLPDVATSSALLREFLDHLRSAVFTGQSTLAGTERTATGAGPRPPTPAGVSKRNHGTAVTVTIVRLRDKGGYHVQEAGRPEGIVNLGRPPSPPPEPGAVATVYIHDDNPRGPQYRWDQPSPVTVSRGGYNRGGQGRSSGRR